MKRIRRHLAFIQSILKQANRYKREELLTHANADQINALSEVILNLLKKKHSDTFRKNVEASQTS